MHSDLRNKFGSSTNIRLHLRLSFKFMALIMKKKSHFVGTNKLTLIHDLLVSLGCIWNFYHKGKRGKIFGCWRIIPWDCRTHLKTEVYKMALRTTICSWGWIRSNRVKVRVSNELTCRNIEVTPIEDKMRRIVGDTFDIFNLDPWVRI